MRNGNNQRAGTEYRKPKTRVVTAVLKEDTQCLENQSKTEADKAVEQIKVEAAVSKPKAKGKAEIQIKEDKRDGTRVSIPSTKRIC